MAQDSWSPVLTNGLSDPYNDQVRALHVFKGQIYAALGNDSAKLIRSSTGNMNDWTPAYSPSNYYSINHIVSTTNGGGYMYMTGSSTGGADTQRVFRSFDGITWENFYRSPFYLSYMIPFKGLGTVDSIHLVSEGANGSYIIKGAYNTTDSTGAFGGWDTVLNLEIASPSTYIQCVGKHGAKAYFGTNNGAMLWSSDDGNNWLQNINVGTGFGNINNSAITSIASFGGAIYAGTDNYQDGAQLWSSTDEITWTLVQQFNPPYTKVSSLSVADGKLWVTLFGGPQQEILKSTDGVTYTPSNTNGFGVSGITGNNANIIQFGNNIYWGGENYFPLKSVTRNTTTPGAQIWRLCTVVPAPFSAGPDQVVCQGAIGNLVADPGFTGYLWDNGSTSQTLSTVIPGDHIVYANDLTSGCSVSDTAALSIIHSPISTVTSPSILPSYICSGNSTSIATNNYSNVRNPIDTVNKISNDTILDYAYSYDTISVSGINDSAALAVSNVIIDSLYHTYDGDVEMKLFAPNGSFITLNYGTGAGSANFFGTNFNLDAINPINSGTGPFTGNYLPAEPFTNLSGPANGNWILEIYDHAGGDVGVLRGWTMQFSKADTNLTFSWTPTIGLSSTTTPNVTTVTPTATTDYILAVTNSLGCTTKDTVQLIVPKIVITPSPATVCYGSSATLSATGGVNYYWSPATFLSDTLGSSVNTNATSNITYYVNDTVGGCAIMDSVYVTANPLFLVTASLPQTICFGTNATLTATGSGGTPGYSYNWNDGSSNTAGQSILVSPTSGTSYTLTALDTNGCYASDFTTVSVTPSTDLVGHAGYSGGNVTSGNAVAFRYYPTYTYFDTVQVAPLNASGNYTFTALNSGDYLIKIFADTLLYPTLDATYFGDTWAWDTATVVTHGCSVVDTANVTMVEELGITGGPGNLRGRITEDVGFGGMAAWGNGMGRAPGEPIPGIDVKLGKNPGGAMMGSTTTSSATASDGGGYYYFTNIPLNAPGGSYTVYVDIPGLERDSSYTVVLDAVTNQYVYLDYIVDSTSIFIVPNAGVGISNPDVAVENKFGVYPNPSKGNATIEYTIATDATVLLSVYNVLGVKVSELVNEEQKSGKHKYSINGNDTPLNSGIYFITLITDGKASTQRLIISE